MCQANILGRTLLSLGLLSMSFIDVNYETVFGQEDVLWDLLPHGMPYSDRLLSHDRSPLADTQGLLTSYSRETGRPLWETNPWHRVLSIVWTSIFIAMSEEEQKTTFLQLPCYAFVK